MYDKPFDTFKTSEVIHHFLLVNGFNLIGDGIAHLFAIIHAP